MAISTGMKRTLAALLILGATACGNSSSPTMPSATTVDASIGSTAFTPNPINISVGSTVTWTNQDSAAHDVVADGGAFASGSIAPGGKYSYRFPSAGTFAYHDDTHPNMTGTVNVTGSSSPNPY